MLEEFLSLKLQQIYQNLCFEILLVNCFLAVIGRWTLLVKLTDHFSEKCDINGQVHFSEKKVLHTSECILVFLS